MEPRETEIWDMEDRYERAQVLSRDERLHSALVELSRSPDGWDISRVDAKPALRERGLEVEDGLEVHFVRDRGRPIQDDYFPFKIRFTHCRKIWIWGPDDPPRLEEFCLGVEIIPVFDPWGPVKREG